MDKNSSLPDYIFEQLKATFPIIFTRAYAAEHLGGLFSKKTLANFKTAFPPPSYLLGGKRVYVRDEFFDWLRSYCGTGEKSDNTTERDSNSTETTRNSSEEPES